MKNQWSRLVCAVPLIAIVTSAHAQNAEHVAKMLGISELVRNARLMHTHTPCESAATVEELSAREDILETVIATSLEVDGVLAELDNERAHLSELSAILQAQRDRSVNLTNVANLITGTGLGIAVNAMQFSSSTANVGNGLGVASGIGSTVLSIIGIRRQAGPHRSVGRIPNMLAPLFGRQAQLNSYYPEPVLGYLRSIPPGQSPDVGSRLDQLMSEWRQAGRLGPSGSPINDKKVTRLTSSLDDKTKLSIDDLSDRMAMLADVSGRVALMKRDLAELMRTGHSERTCAQHGTNVVPENDWSELTASMEKMHVTSNTVSVIDPSNNKLLGVIRLGDPVPGALSPLYRGELLVHGLGYSPDSRTLAVVSVGSNSVTLIETATTQALVYVPGAVPNGPGTDNLSPLGESGNTVRLLLHAGGTVLPDAQASVAVNSLGLLDLVQIAAKGLAPTSEYQVYLAESDHAPFGKLEPLTILKTNPDGAGIVQAIGPLKTLADRTGGSTSLPSRRFLVTELKNASQVVLR